MGAYQDEIIAEHASSILVHLPLHEVIPGVVEVIRNTPETFINIHDAAVSGSKPSIVNGESNSARYVNTAHTHGEIASNTNLRSIRVWFKAEFDGETILEVGRSDDVYQNIKVYFKDDRIKVDIDNTTLTSSIEVKVGVKTFIFIEIVSGIFRLYINGAKNNDEDIEHSGLESNFKFSWYRLGASVHYSSLINELDDPLTDQFGNHLVIASSDSLTDPSGNPLTDEFGNIIY